MYLIQYKTSKVPAYYGNNSKHPSIACYISKRAAEKTINRIDFYMKYYKHPPCIYSLYKINTVLQRRSDLFEIVYKDKDFFTLLCSINNIGIHTCVDFDGISYEYDPSVDFGTDVYKTYLNSLISKRI